MAENTKIEWATHTFNPWIGCSKISPACDFCYAEELMDTRYGRVEWGGDRVRTASGTWAQPLKWNREAERKGAYTTVFCLSLGDIWDNEIDTIWRRDLFDVIERTPALTWLLLSKRIGNAEKMCSPFAGNPVLPPNAALGATMVNQQEWDRDAPKLKHAGEILGAKFTFASIEPMLGPMDIRENTPDWVIAGGESGAHARPSHPGWFQSLRDQCAAGDVPFLFKQWGSWGRAAPRPSGTPGRFAIANAGPYSDFSPAMVTPTDFYPRQFAIFGGSTVREFVGKKAAGRLLDGVEHNGFPKVGP